MFKSFLKIGWRNLLRSKGYSMINIGGLSMGMAVAMLIGLWVYDELSYNKYHQTYDEVVRVIKGADNKGKLFAGQTWLPYPLVNELKTSYHNNFKHIVSAWPEGEYILSTSEKKISRVGQYIDKGGPEMLGLKMIYGTHKGLYDPHSIILSESTAKMLFADADPIGQTIRLNDESDVMVTGVYEDLPANTDFNLVQFFVPWELNVMINPSITEQGWDNHFFFAYAQLARGTSLKTASDNVRDAELRATKGLEIASTYGDSRPLIFLLPMKDWHLRADFQDGVASRGPLQFVCLVGVIGAFVLILACINFMNLSTARSERRAKEVGIRKTVGSARVQIIGQFFSESFLIVILSFALTIVLVKLSLPWFNDIAAKQIVIPWSSPMFWACCLSFVFLTSVLAGTYPALFLSSFSPVKVLKGALRTGRFAATPRKVLVVLQFAISMTLITCTWIVRNQIMFAKERSTGYDGERLIMIRKISKEFYGKHEVLRNELKETGVVEEMSESGGLTTEGWSQGDGFSWVGKDPLVQENFGTMSVSPEYGKTVGWQFLEGRDFSRASAGDSSGFVINQAAAKFMGLSSPVNEIVHWKGRWYDIDKDFKILGIIKDVVMKSPYDPVQPAVFFLEGHHGCINVRIKPDVNVTEALSRIELVFKKVIPSAPFHYQFADVEYDKKFAAEDRISKLTSVFSTLTIFISCLGLLGLASFTAEQRTKELGIRKVLGATAFSLWKLLSRDFVLLVLISCVVAIPAAYFAMTNWLQQFQYRITVSWQVFAFSVLGLVVLTLMVVSYQAVRAAVSDPVKSLRSE